MKNVPLQLVTVCLENGRQGIFVGIPLVTSERDTEEECQVEEIWFSEVQQIPAQLPLAKLLRMVAEQICRSQMVMQ